MKKEILKILRNSEKPYYSGERISNILGVSRTAVWKNIKKLREDGYNINSVPSKGYFLEKDNNQLNKEELSIIIEKYSFIDISFFYDSIDSTNEVLKRKSTDYADKSLIAVSLEQTKGKGRLGRVWESKNGIYMSYLLRPDILPMKATLFTQIAAAAMVQTFRKKFGLTVEIKWPNDIIVNGKKISGILTELNAELNKVNYIVLGIGVNLNQDSFSDSLSEIATSYFIEEKKILNPKIFLEEFLIFFSELINEFLHNDSIERTLNICRKYSAIIGKEVYVINANDRRKVFVKNINEEGQLIVENKNGEEEIIFYGEISIRGLEGKYI